MFHDRATRIMPLVVCLLACGGDNTGPDADRPASLAVVEGDMQGGIVGSVLPGLIRVRVVNASSRPMSGIRVDWSTLSGSVSPSSSTTNAEGVAATSWILGSTAGMQELTARAGSLQATVHSHAAAGPPSAMKHAGGEGQTGTVGEDLPQPLAVLVSDAYGNPVEGALVDWEVTAGDGRFDTATTVSLADGIARATWRLGTKSSDAQMATAHAGQLASLTFTATARPGPAAQIELSASTASIPVGETLTVVATITDEFGNPIIDRPPTWSSTAATVATVDDGVVQAVAPGPAVIQASLDGKSAPLALEVLAVVPPVITGISPSPLRPGIVATMSGTGFSPVAAGNTIRVAGVGATTTAATATTITFEVPAAASLGCQPTQDVDVAVTVPDLTTTVRHSLQWAEKLNLAVGESVLRTDEESSRCNELERTGGAYLVTVFDPGTDPAGSSSFRLRGASPTLAAAQVAVARKSLGTSPDEATLFEPPPRSEAEVRADRIHARLLDARARLYAGRPATAGQVARARIPPPQVGDGLIIRVPDITANDLCSAYTEIATRVLYVGQYAVILEDTQNPYAGYVTSQLISLATEYDLRLHALLLSTFGDPLAHDGSLDANGRIFMVFTQRVELMGGPSLQGFVSPTDWMPRSQCASSNVGEIFYARVPQVPSQISSWFRIMPATMIHEMKHVTSMAERFARNATVLEASWLEEATAQIAVEIWARQIFGYTERSNVGFAASVGCEIQSCAGRPIAMWPHFDYLYAYYRDINLRTFLGNPDGYGSGWHFIRWVIDQFASSEAGFLTALTQETTLEGVESLVSRLPVSFTELLGWWGLSLYTDDAPIPVSPRLQSPSWNTLDIFAGLRNSLPATYPFAFPLAGYTVSFGNWHADVGYNRTGSATYFVIDGFQLAPQLLSLERHPNASGPPSAVRLGIVRLR